MKHTHNQVETEMIKDQPIPNPTVSLELPGSLVLQVNQSQFESLAQANRDLRLERTAVGELIVNPPTGGESGKRNLSISTQLGNWFEAYEQLGEAFDSSTGFKLPNGADRSPDASWVSRERWESLTPQQRKGFVPLCPDFVIELRSESDSQVKLQAILERIYPEWGPLRMVNQSTEEASRDLSSGNRSRSIRQSHTFVRGRCFTWVYS